MRSWPVDSPIAGELATPNEFNEEIAEIGGAIHGLDRDHSAYGRMGAAKLAPNAILSLTLSKSDTSYVDTHQVGDSYPGGRPIPNDLGDPWVVPVTTGDGVLKMTLSAMWGDQLTFLPLRVWIGIQIDGTLVARSPIQPRTPQRASTLVRANVPVGGGTHRVALVYGLHESITGSPRQVTWFDRSFSALEGIR